MDSEMFAQGLDSNRDYMKVTQVDEVITPLDGLVLAEVGSQLGLTVPLGHSIKHSSKKGNFVRGEVDDLLSISQEVEDEWDEDAPIAEWTMVDKKIQRQK